MNKSLLKRNIKVLSLFLGAALLLGLVSSGAHSSPPPANQPPVLSTISDQVVTRGEKVEFHVHASDPDSDSLIYIIENSPSGAIFEGSPPFFTWEPQLPGIFRDIAVSVTDGLQSDTRTFTIIVQDTPNVPDPTSEWVQNPATEEPNRPPMLSLILNRIITQGQNILIPIYASDPEGDSLVFRVENLPAGATFGGSPAVLTWTPQYSGKYEGIKIEVSDGQASVSQIFTIEVLPPEPTVTPKPPVIEPEKESIGMIIYYGSHNASIDKRILEASPEYLIANTSHGLWSELTGKDFFPTMNLYKDSGIKIIGYITSGYEGKGSGGQIIPEWYSLETNRRLIKNMAEFDMIDGIFIDECSAFPDAASREYLTELTCYARSLGLMTWGNVGVAHFDTWYFTGGCFDMMHANENWNGQNLTQVQQAYGDRISVTGLHANLSASEVYALTKDAVAKGLAYCYISTSYSSLPAWFEQYVALTKVAPQTLLTEGLAGMIIFYGLHNETTDTRLLKAKPEYLIANPSHGLWSEISGVDCFPGSSLFREAGVQIVGYITAGYEGTISGGDIAPAWYSLETNLRLINNMAERDMINGVFVDECSAFPNQASKEYLLELTKMAHSYGLLTWGNVGVADFDSWYFTEGGFDLVNTNENWQGQGLSAVQRDWGHRISVTGLHTQMTAEAASALTSNALAKGLAHCYISPDYVSLPTWLE